MKIENLKIGDKVRLISLDKAERISDPVDIITDLMKKHWNEILKINNIFPGCGVVVIELDSYIWYYDPRWIRCRVKQLN